MTAFLSKATGSAVDWVPLTRMKSGPDSGRIVYISHNCVGVAARACTVVPLDPIKIMEILKDRPSWFRDCRKMEVFANFPARNGGTVELIYMQFYAPTILAFAREFWTLRYTSTLEDGSLVVCETSMSGSGAALSSPAALEFVRAKMLASGYLIRPCEGEGSIIHIVDHLDLEALTVPEVVQPLCESSKLVAQKMTISDSYWPSKPTRRLVTGIKVISMLPTMEISTDVFAQLKALPLCLRLRQPKALPLHQRALAEYLTSGVVVFEGGGWWVSQWVFEGGVG
ncbi:unnamed protein product [Ilex paraguariensis]